MTTSISVTATLPEIASQFPVLSREIGGKPITYLDSAATSQTPQPVIDAMTSYYTHSRASIHRGVYPLAVEATDLYEGARGRIAEWLGSTPEETIFTSNATAGINLVAYTWGRHNVNRGDLVVLTEMEHHSNIVPWQLLCQDREAELAYVPVLEDGQLDMDALDELLARSPKLVGVVHVSNVLGTINPVAEIARRAHEAGADGDGGRQPGDPATAGRPACDRRRLLRLDRPQGLRPDRDRRAPRPPRAARGDAAVHRGRAHDPHGRGQRVDVDRPALEVRGGDLADRRGDRPRGRGRLAARARHGPRPRARAGAHGRGARAARHRDPRPDRVRPRRPRPTAARSCRSRSRALIPTTSGRSSVARECACAPVTTVRSR